LKNRHAGKTNTAAVATDINREETHRDINCKAVF